ncbi:RNA guanine-N7 methyltransferase activating subunit-like [Salarias fasciatus]|uniref:RNA guanine-N7 methyltransferase activating subunit-like n=1 Tax=Salarias fasciatus TaxID=181472 RepID=UPI001176A839|nr:RNA guanine-N7 methyltransferase activating subunit [Salarias fasciatus]
MAESTEISESYEEMFANRFTSEDAKYQEYLSRPVDPPPIVEDWRGRGGGSQRGRDNRYQDRRGGDHRGWGGGDRGWGGGDRGGGRPGEYRGQQQWHDRDRDRNWGHGSGYQSGHSSSNQGYNSHHQRPHYDHD